MFEICPAKVKFDVPAKPADDCPLSIHHSALRKCPVVIMVDVYAPREEETNTVSVAIIDRKWEDFLTWIEQSELCIG